MSTSLDPVVGKKLQRFGRRRRQFIRVRGFCAGIVSFLLFMSAIAFADWGCTAIIIGLLLGGVGVVPIAILASFISIGSLSMGLSIIVMSIVTIGARFYSFHIKYG